MIDKIIQTNMYCTGCSACYSICPMSAIKMQMTNGFYFPTIVSNKCIGCRKCINVCPQNNKITDSNFKTIAYACKNKDESIRIKSASGGIFSALAEKILSGNGIVYGVAYDDNFLAHHIRVDDISDLVKLRRSKYMQSFIGDVFAKVLNDLNNGKLVLFSGTPCQCSGLYSFLGKEYESLIIIEVLCHGAPSPRIWANYLKYRIKKAHAKDVVECMFHTKDTHPKSSWSNSYMYIKFDASEYNINGLYDPYMMLFARSNVILNESCYQCRYRKLIDRNYVDISLCDFWNIDKVNKSFDDDKGVSLMMLHSPKAMKFYAKIEANLDYITVNVDKSLAFNPSSNQPKRRRSDRKVSNILIKRTEDFGIIYYLYLPIIYLRKIISKIMKIITR